MTRKLTKKEEDEFEYMCNLDPTTVFYEPSSDYKLFIYKKLLFAEEQTSYMGMELSHLSFHNTSYEKILNTLYYLQQNKIINIINYDVRKQNIINENGINHEALLPKSNTKYIDLVFKYEIINEKKLLEIIGNDISEFQNDIIYDLLHERCNKNFLKSCEKNNVSLPYLQQKKETIKILNKINHNKIGYFK